MKGKKEYELQYNRKITNLLEKNNDKSYLLGFYNYMKSSKLAYSTMYDYLSYANNFIEYVGKDIAKLNFDDYTNFISQYADLRASYQIGVYSGIKKFSEYLFASGKTKTDPMLKIRRPKFSEDDETVMKRERGYLEKSEIKKLLKSAYEGAGSSRAMARQENWKERDILIIKIFLSTGIRCSALYKLNIEDVDLYNKTLRITDKGNKTKVIFLSKDIISAAIEWIDSREVILDKQKEDALFISNRKTRMNQSSIARVVEKYAACIEGKDITPHKLRATFGTQLYNETGDVYFVQDCMGHSNPKTTEGYIRGKRKNSQKASDILDNIMHL